jgi:antitoxin ParD1/3/4
MMKGMTKEKIAITISQEHLAAAKRAVAEGRASSVSAYIDAALTSLNKTRPLELYLRSLEQDFGKPSAEDYAWADEQIERVNKEWSERGQ